MERELWYQLYELAIELDRTGNKSFYRTWEIVVVYFWAVMHDRPTSWACDPKNWNEVWMAQLPSQSTMSRRLRSPSVQQLMDDIFESFLTMVVLTRYLCIDGKPLPVGSHTHDPDAKLGRAGSGFAKGYKLHAIWGNGPIPLVWGVTSMNTGESKVAKDLVRRAPKHGYIVGDKQYDSNPLHSVASQNGIQIIAAQKRPGKALGHCQHSPARIKCFEILQTKFGEQLLKFRDQIERRFGHLTCFGCGLGPLPSWVRRIHRVKLWVQAKLITNALQITYKPASPKTALA